MQINKYVNKLPYFNYQQQIMTMAFDIGTHFLCGTDQRFILPPGEAVISQW